MAQFYGKANEPKLGDVANDILHVANNHCYVLFMPLFQKM